MSLDDDAVEARAQGWRTLAALHARIEDKLQHALERDHELSVSEYTVLDVLGRQNGFHLRMNQLANAVVLSQSATTRLVTRLDQQPDLALGVHQVASVGEGRAEAAVDRTAGVPPGPVRRGEQREFGWDHSLGEIVTALIDAGLLIESVREYPFCDWKLDFLVEGDDGRWRMPGELDGRLPLSVLEDDDELDRLLGAVLTTADESFNTILELGFASSIRKEWEWRNLRGESTRNLEAFRGWLEAEAEDAGSGGDEDEQEPDERR